MDVGEGGPLGRVTRAHLRNGGGVERVAYRGRGGRERCGQGRREWAVALECQGTERPRKMRVGL